MARVPVLEDLGDVAGKRVLVRTDFNVPMHGPDDAREISDDFRIRAALPTIEWLTSRGATVVCASHLGRPKGTPEAKYSMEPIRRRLAELAPGVELLENLRFNAGEEGNSPEFVANLVKGIDMYVNDAFGAAHRSHASIVGPPRSLPSAAGRLLEREVEILGSLRESPKRPFVAVLGGAIVSDKIGVIEALLRVVDSLVIGGGMCFTFLAAKGYPVGDSLCELDQIATCKKLLENSKPIYLPEDINGLDASGQFASYGVRLLVHLLMSSWMLVLSFGTDQWACSKMFDLLPELAQLQRPWPQRKLSPLSVAGTVLLHLQLLILTIRLTMYPPVVEHR